MTTDETTAKDTMRQKIEAAIAQWQSSVAKPPFTAKQLVITALLWFGDAVSTDDIFKWIVDSLRYYRHLVSDGFCTYWHRAPSHGW